MVSEVHILKYRMAVLGLVTTGSAVVDGGLRLFLCGENQSLWLSEENSPSTHKQLVLSHSRCFLVTLSDARGTFYIHCKTS